MKLKPAYKFQLSEVIAPMKVFYVIIFLIEVLIISFVASNGSMSGIDFSSVIFLFIMGLSMFKTPFHFLAGNSVSRKTIIKSTFLTGITIAGIMFVIDTLNAIFLKALNIFSVKYVALFETAFGQKIEGINILRYIIFNLATYLCFFMIGYFIGVVNYRLSQKLKIIIVVGMFAFLTIVLPYLAGYINGYLDASNYKFHYKIRDFFSTNIVHSPTGSIITELVLIAIFGLISYRVAIRASLNAK